MAWRCANTKKKGFGVFIMVWGMLVQIKWNLNTKAHTTILDNLQLCGHSVRDDLVCQDQCPCAEEDVLGELVFVWKKWTGMPAVSQAYCPTTGPNLTNAPVAECEDNPNRFQNCVESFSRSVLRTIVQRCKCVNTITKKSKLHSTCEERKWSVLQYTLLSYELISIDFAACRVFTAIWWLEASWRGRFLSGASKLRGGSLSPPTPKSLIENIDSPHTYVYSYRWLSYSPLFL